MKDEEIRNTSEPKPDYTRNEGPFHGIYRTRIGERVLMNGTVGHFIDETGRSESSWFLWDENGNSLKNSGWNLVSREKDKEIY